MLITKDHIYAAIEDHNRRAQVVANVTIPPDTRQMLDHAWELTERDQLNLADYRAFWAINWTYVLMSRNLIRSATDKILSGPIPDDDRHFLQLLELTIEYLSCRFVQSGEPAPHN